MWSWSFWPFKRKVRIPQVSYDTLRVANRLREQRGLPKLDRFTAQTAVAGSYESPGFDMLGFLVGYETGIPIGLTTGSLMGAALHPSPAVADTSPGWYSDTARSRDVEPMVPARYTDQETRRRDEEPVTPVYTHTYTPSADQEIFYKPARESFYDSTPSHSTPSSSDDNRSSYSDSSPSYPSSSSSSE